MAKMSEIKIEVGFDGDGFAKALREYLEIACVGRAYSAELHDEIVERAISLTSDFTQFAVVGMA
jgi:xanthine dehydrogenase molybdopterin-binding subunit B